MAGDLEGILVVSIEQAVAAPYASCRLADAGARVIKAERKEGDFARGYDTFVNGLSAYFVWLNRGKESLLVDLKSATDRALLLRILASADVFIQNLAPGALDRVGLASSRLRSLYPRLITCDISGYGTSGPYRDMKAYDLLVQAESGLAWITGSAEGPGRVGVSVCDIAAGMYACQAILQALFVRERTGAGRTIEVSLFHSLADWMNVPYLQSRYGNYKPARPGLHHPSIAPYGSYACGDGRCILISIQNQREWLRFCEAILGSPELAKDARFRSNPDRLANRAALDEIISKNFTAVPRDELVERLAAAGIAFGRLSNLDDLLRHPQNRYVRVQSGHGEIELFAPPALVPGEQLTLGAVPALGEHDQAIRDEFQVSATAT